MRNMKRKLFALLLTICLFLSGLPHYEVFADTTEQEEEETPEIVKVDLGITDFALAVGHEKEIIIPDYEYEGAILEKRVKWTFSKGAKAKLELTEEGKIRALGKGKVSLKVKVDYYKDETLIAQGSKFFYVYATRPNISVTDYSYNMYEKKTVNIPLEGCYSLSKVKFKSSSKKLNVKQKGLSLDVTPSKAGKYSVDVTVDEVEFKLNFEVYNLYFKKAPNTIADASSKNWVNGRSMICMKKNDRASLVMQEPEETTQKETEIVAKPQEVETQEAQIVANAPSFHAEDKLQWPVAGEVLLDYSMDKAIYFSTMQQYRYNPSVVIAAKEGDTITAAADATVKKIYHDAQTGDSILFDLGNGYELTYGQLTDITLKEGQQVKAGDTIGKVAKPTLFYSVEGSNVYFKMTKDGEPVNPLENME